jgi:purine/pyrimidine-nucleoside phosphorylase
MSQFNDVSVVQKANVYFDGKCVSHTVVLADGTRKSVGVILPGAQLTFNTGTKEIMECVAGRASVKLPGATAFVEFGAGESFSVASGATFLIEAVGEPYHYVCHFG